MGMPIWIVLYNHRCWTDAFLMVKNDKPTEDEMIAQCPVTTEFDLDHGEMIRAIETSYTMPDNAELLDAAKHLLEAWESNKNLSQAAQRIAAAVRNVQGDA